MSGDRPTQRLDQWLWMARFFKTRGLATKLVQAGRVRVDGTPVEKPAAKVSPGQTLTFPQQRRIRVVRIEAIAARRGPAPEAQGLYTDLTSPDEDPKPRVGPRPTGKARRDLDKLNEE